MTELKKAERVQQLDLFNRMYGNEEDEAISKADSDKFSKKQQKTALRSIKDKDSEVDKITGYALKSIAEDKMKWLR